MILALDSDGARLQRVRENFARLGLDPGELGSIGSILDLIERESA